MKASLLLILFLSFRCAAQIPSGYYDPANGLTGEALKIALHDIIDNHQAQSYSSLLTHFQITDVKPNGKVWDIYSDIPDSMPAYEYDFNNNCGSYNSEGDCYNREHSWPQSWFNSALPMQSDMFHVYPTDGYVNGRRGNDPFSEVDAPVWVSTNGGKLGPSVFPGYTGSSFEPIDEYKGDLARSYFYMSTRYYSEDSTWMTTDMVEKSQLKEWSKNLLIKWHQEDPVSPKEISRNNEIYQIQNNRNPYIDHPEYVTEIWISTLSVSNPVNMDIQIFPNPSEGIIAISGTHTGDDIRITDISGRTIAFQKSSGKNVFELNEPGLYIIIITNERSVRSSKVIIQ